MHWQIDERTAHAAATYSLLTDVASPSLQYQGCLTDTWTWEKRIVQPVTWNMGLLSSKPSAIIKEFQAGRYTQGLALVVSWGKMGRTARYIYFDEEPPTILRIEKTLQQCAESIQKTESISESWQILTGSGNGALGWTEVITSKTLHFLCRALGFEQDPPVAIDGEWIRGHVWPAFRNSIPPERRPGSWNGKTFEAYCRYMSAILTWAAQRHWTTTQVEATLMDVFESGLSAGKGCGA